MRGVSSGCGGGSDPPTRAQASPDHGRGWTGHPQRSLPGRRRCPSCGVRAAVGVRAVAEGSEGSEPRPGHPPVGQAAVRVRTSREHIDPVEVAGGEEEIRRLARLEAHDEGHRAMRGPRSNRATKVPGSDRSREGSMAAGSRCQLRGDRLGCALPRRRRKYQREARTKVPSRHGALSAVSDVTSATPARPPVLPG